MIGRERYDNLLSLLSLDDDAAAGVEAASDDEHEPSEGTGRKGKAKQRGKRPTPALDSSAKKSKKGDD
jgi:hypothetical protein